MLTSLLTVLNDLRYALRGAVRRPVPFVISVVTIALVTGAAGAVGAVAIAAFVRPLPFPDQARLVRIYTMPPGVTSFDQANPLHPREFVRFRERPGPLAAIEGIWARERAVGGDGEPESYPTGSVSAGFLALLGGPPLLGRTFRPEDDLDAAKVAVLSHGFWMRRFGGDRHVLGRTLLIDREPHEIVGVMPAGFVPAFVRSELWTPLGIRDGRFVLENSTFIQTLAKPRPGLTLDQTRAELESMFEAVRTESPATLKGWEVGARPLRDAQFGAQRPAILMLVAAVAIVTLIAAVNLTHLSIAETMSRRGEIAVRLALGARRRDILRWQLADRVVTTGIGGALGLCLAWLALPTVTALDPTGLSSRVAVHIDWTVVTTTLLFVGIVTVGASLIPAWRASQHELAPTLSGSSHRSSGTPRQRRLRLVLVGVEMSLAVLLLSTGAILLDGFRRTAATDPGFDSSNVVAAQIRFSEIAYPTEDARAAFVSAVLERVRRVPGVTDAGTTQNLFVPGFFFVTLVQIDGRPTPTGEPHTVQFRRVSPGYFKTMRIPELSGRTFDSRDVKSAQRVAVVSAQFARQFWPGEDPIGRTVRRGTAGQLTVIGVVGDVRDVGYGAAAAPTIYTSYAQNNVATAPVGLIVRTDRGRPDLIASVKRAIREIDPAQPLANVTALETFLHESLGPQRFRSALLLVFAALGLLLACVGVYGVTGRMVLERAREAGVRLALGASTGRVWWTIGSRALAGVATGAVVGLLLALVAHAGLVNALPELANGTPLRTALPAFALLLLTGTVSALFPARRAARVDPVTALRADELG